MTGIISLFNKKDRYHMAAVTNKLKALGTDKKMINVFTYFHVKKLIKKWRKRAKNSRHRLYVLQEWIATEKSYIKDLRVLQEDIRKPLVNPKPPVITKEQQMTMFANVDVIITLSMSMLETLDKLLKSWDPLTTQIAPSLIGLHAFFKIYLEYCNQFYKGQNVLKLIKGDPVVQAIEKKLPLDIASYLIKPVQRPPKYLLLLRDFQKHMPESHPDYKNLSIAIKKYHEVNEINNEAIARQARVERMFYLAKLYDELLRSTREFVNEFQGSVFEESVKIYVLSDMVLITKEVDQKQTLFRVILLDGSSFVRRPVDGKYFSNKVFVCGRSECINLIFFNDRSADNVAETLKGVIEKLFKKDLERRSLIANVTWKRPDVKVRITLAEQRVEQLSFQPRFRISVEGTEKRPVSKLKDETMYIIKYQLSQPWRLYQYVYTEFNTIEEVEKIVRKRYPTIGAINLKAENIKMGSFEETREKTRVVQYRQLIITEFLNYILRCDQLMTNPVSLIETLRINESLWTLAVDETKEKCSCQLCINQSDPINLQAYLVQRWHYIRMSGLIPSQQYCLKKYLNDKSKLLKLPIEQFNTVDRMLLYLDTLEGRIEYSQLYNSIKADYYTVKIWFQNVSFKEYVETKITKSTRVEEVMAIIGTDFGIQFMQDFGLFVYYSDTPRLLDGDEVLYDVLMQTQTEVAQVKDKNFLWGGISTLKKWGEEAIRGKKSKIYIRKYFFFPYQMQLDACHKDSQRYMLIIEQILYDIKRGYIKLSNEQYARLSAYFVCIKEIDRIAHVKCSNFPVERIKQVLPQSKMDLASNEEWMTDVKAVFEGKKLSIVGVQQKLQKICDEIFKIVRMNTLWKSFMYPAENYDPGTLKHNKRHVHIGVNSDNFVVYDESMTLQLLSLPIVHLSYKITVFSMFVTDDETNHRFDGVLFYNLHKVIERYKLMRKLVVTDGPQ